MNVTYENVIVDGDRIEPGLLIWRRYRLPAPGVTELFMDINPHIRAHMRESVYLPMGVPLLLPIVDEIIKGKPQPIDAVRFWGTAKAT